jgi:chemotaxis family two-component system sensor kinase Cph1
MNAEIRFGEVDLTTCDREPIHIPGSIQPHGVLLIVDRQGFAIEQVAGDTRHLLGMDAAGLLGLSLSALFDTDTLAFVTETLCSPATRIAPLLRLSVTARRSPLPLDITLSADGRTVLIEIEHARRAGASIGDPIAQLKRLLSALAETSTVDQCCAAAAVTLRSATGFDRAMVYRFEPDESGVVVAEDLAPGMEPFLGLHYPASDIPQQAREMYKRNWLRAIPDVRYVPAELRPARNARTGSPIDMSSCSLRSVSPIHLEYLRNMGVGATLAMSVVCGGKLWGILVLHHGAPLDVPSHVRVACETFAQVFSLQIEATTLTDQSMLRINTRRIREGVVSRLSTARDIGAELACRDLLRYVNANGMAVSVAGKWHTYGFVPCAADLQALMEWRNTIDDPLFATDRLADVNPAAAAYSDTVSGMLAVALTRTSRDHVLWFRAEYETTVRWAGDPSKALVVEENGSRLTPRGSFAEWRQVKRCQAQPWSEIDLEAAEALRVVLLESVLKAADKTLQDRERAIQRQNLLLAELDHRVKNALTKIESLVVKSSTTETSVRTFATGLRHRIQAMAQTHTLLSEGKWVGTSLRTLIETDVVPASENHRARMTLAGDDILLSPLEALALSMVLHELMTNAERHGALSTEQGNIAIEWLIDTTAAVICLSWRETARLVVSSVLVPRNGIDLIQRTVEEELGGTHGFELRVAASPR